MAAKIEECLELVADSMSIPVGCEASIALVVASLIFGIIFLTLAYIYHALAWKAIAAKLNHPKPWLAWIPFASSAMRLQLGRFDWRLIFLLLIPFLGWAAVFVLLIVAHWRIFELRNHYGWFSLSWIIPDVGLLLYLIAIGFVAWTNPTKRSRLPKKSTSHIKARTGNVSSKKKKKKVVKKA